MLFVCNFVFAEIEDYCPENLSILVEFSTFTVGFSRSIGESVRLTCIMGYSTYQNALLIATCEEYSYTEGQWRISGSCQRTRLNFHFIFIDYCADCSRPVEELENCGAIKGVGSDGNPGGDPGGAAPGRGRNFLKN